MDDFVFQGSVWQWRRAGTRLCGRGDHRHLAAPLTAFFASRDCPGAAIRAGMAWALQQARARAPVIGGFHSPLERSVLDLLLEARSPAVLVLARAVESARLQHRWTEAIICGHLVVVSAAERALQLNQQRAVVRNELVAQLAARIVVAHASPEGGLASQTSRWRERGMALCCLSAV